VQKLGFDFGGEFPVRLLGKDRHRYQQQHEQCPDFFHYVLFVPFRG
jgi:hypothetical protein